ncbi:caspase domain-containing protein [Streptomyces sp. NPDC002889]|uniref:caspase family protein n=1 Tax=Streptomyces sp. NPDC002889 TaxID=3364669 RepID=UPI0036A565A5
MTSRRHLAKPALEEGALKDLNDALHDLLRKAGRPSTREIAADLEGELDPPPSHTRVYDLFTKGRLPDWRLTMCVVEVLANRARGLDPQAEGDRFHHLWTVADDELVLDPRVTAADLPPRGAEAGPDQQAVHWGTFADRDQMLPDRGTSRSVFVGISQYTTLTPLPTVDQGTRDLASALTNRHTGGFSEAGSHLLLEPGSAEEVLESIRSASAQATDTLLLFFAGHGLVDDHSGDLQLALPDTRIGAEYYTTVPYQWIRRSLLDSTARRKVVILDCCFSGRAFAGTMSGGHADMATIEGTALLTATAQGSLAMAPLGESYPTFTGELIRILQDGIPDGPPVLGIDLIFRELQNRLRAKARPEPQFRSRGTVGGLALAANPAYRHP